MLYSDVLTEMYGEDKQEALRYIEDDFQFDAWLKRYAAKMNKGSRPTSGTPVSKDKFQTRTKGMLPNPSR